MASYDIKKSNLSNGIEKKELYSVENQMEFIAKWKDLISGGHSKEKIIDEIYDDVLNIEYNHEKEIEIISELYWLFSEKESIYAQFDRIKEIILSF